MKLGDVIHDYRTSHKMSMEEFAKRSGLSKAYIGFLEKGYHPKSLTPIKPSIDAINKCACAMNMEFSTLFNSLDEVVTLNPSKEETEFEIRADEEMALIDAYRKATPEVQNMITYLLKIGQPHDTDPKPNGKDGEQAPHPDREE